MSMTGTIRALFCNQCKDVLKNREVLILFFVYPLVGAIMNSAVPAMYNQGNFFVSIFGTMHIIFSPMVAATALIAEEREKHTLKVLMMSNVTPVDYLLSVGSFVFVCTIITAIPFLFLGGYTGMGIVRVLLFMAFGCICSMVLGGAIGMASKSMTGANATAVPLGLLFAFTPMLSFFSKPVGKVSKYLYGQQISSIIANPSTENITVEGIIIMILNFLLVAILFGYFSKHQIMSD